MVRALYSRADPGCQPPARSIAVASRGVAARELPRAALRDGGQPARQLPEARGGLRSGSAEGASEVLFKDH